MADFCDLFRSDFAQAFWANLLAGLVVGAVAFLVIEWRLHLRRDRTARRALRRATLGIVKDELDHNEAQRQELIALLPQNALPYPLFDLAGWDLLAQADVLTTIEPASAGHLVRVYNRLRTINEAYAHVNDLMFGSTGILAVGAIEAMPTIARIPQEKQFSAIRQSTSERLLDRARELEGPLADARAAVEAELARD